MHDELSRDCLGLAGSDIITREWKTMLMTMCCIYKSKTKILSQINMCTRTMPAEVREILASNFVQLPSEVSNRSDTFAVVHVPICFPGLDLHFWALLTPPDNITFENLCNRVTFSQIWLDSEMQSKAKKGYDRYWDAVKIPGTANGPNAMKTRDDFYKKPMSDKYLLYSADGEEDNRTTAYNKTDIEDWMAARRAYSESELRA